MRRGTVIAAIGPAKWKAGMQYVWVGAAYFWFAARTLATRDGWHGAAWDFIVNAVGSIGVVTMVVSVVLTFWSLALYLRRHGDVIAR
jgi:hypothetical protein